MGLLCFVLFLLAALAGAANAADASPVSEPAVAEPAVATNTASVSPAAPAAPVAPALPVLPDAGTSVLRVFGALALVIAIFLGGAWLFRNWQRFTVYRGRDPLLKIVEVKPLGGRQALYVVDCQEQRLLLASSPSGVSLVSHLARPEAAPEQPNEPVRPVFAEAFRAVLSRK